MRGPSLHSGHAGKLTGQGTRPFSSRCAELPDASAPSLPLPYRVPRQFVVWLCAGPRMTSSAVAELDQLLRRKKPHTCCILFCGREMGYIGETKTGETKMTELAVVCSWVLLAPQLVLGAKCSSDRRRPLWNRLPLTGKSSASLGPAGELIRVPNCCHDHFGMT